MRTQQETVNERTHTYTLRVEDLHPAHQLAVLDLVINLQQVLVAIAVGRDDTRGKNKRALLGQGLRALRVLVSRSSVTARR